MLPFSLSVIALTRSAVGTGHGGVEGVDAVHFDH